MQAKVKISIELLGSEVIFFNSASQSPILKLLLVLWII
jgi:hypothetical protein